VLIIKLHGELLHLQAFNSSILQQLITSVASHSSRDVNQQASSISMIRCIDLLALTPLAFYKTHPTHYVSSQVHQLLIQLNSVID